MSFAQFSNQPNNPPQVVSEGYGKPKDPSNKWNNIQQRCFQNISTISSNVIAAQRMVQKIGTPEDSFEFRNTIRTRLNQVRQLTATVTEDMKTLKQMFNDAPEYASDRKLILAKLSKDYSDWLESFKEVSQLWMEKERKHVTVPQKQMYPSQNKFVPEVDPRKEEKQALLHLGNEIDVHESIIAQREKDIDKIEHDIMDINEMFQDLNTLVVEQGSLIDSIENHIEHAREDVEEGVVELTKASGHQKKAGSKLYIIACILIVVMVVVVVLTVLGALLFGR